MFLLLTTLAALALAAPHPPTNTTHSLTVVLKVVTPSATLACSPGALLCHGNHKYGLCTSDNTVTWEAVAAGTQCVCSSAGDCKIAAIEHGAQGSDSTGSTSKPALTTTSASAPASSQTSASPTASSTTSTSGSSPSSSAISPSGSTYTQFTGNGSVAAGWPSMSDWLSFDDLWTANEQSIGANCETAFGIPNNSPADTAALKTAVLAQSKAANVPAAFSLAILMQESLGCVFVHATNDRVNNPGLLQSHDGAGTCQGLTECPAGEINQMVKDGVSGTTAGPGLKGCGAEAKGSGAQKWYEAARIYNSGSVPWGGNLGSPGATPCYSSDIANRLIGWNTGVTQCTLSN